MATKAAPKTAKKTAPKAAKKTAPKAAPKTAKKAAPKAPSKATPKAATKPKTASKATTKAKAAVKPKATASKSKAAAPRAKTAAPKAKPATRRAVRKPAESNMAVHGIEPYKVKKSEEYMNSDQRVHFTAILNAWKAELMEEVDRTMTHMKDEAANFPDPADRATQEEEFSLELRTRDRERKLIKKIDQTLELIKNDEYGWCDQCGVEIGVRRLEARPTATLCIDCKTLDEIREKQTTA